ncbi:MAG: hypothetical protein JWP47_880 [Polaromonas sp.]|nr:hypothetical protein [Polaromonas sp.]
MREKEGERGSYKSPCLDVVKRGAGSCIANPLRRAGSQTPQYDCGRPSRRLEHPPRVDDALGEITQRRLSFKAAPMARHQGCGLGPDDCRQKRRTRIHGVHPLLALYGVRPLVARFQTGCVGGLLTLMRSHYNVRTSERAPRGGLITAVIVRFQHASISETRGQHEHPYGQHQRCGSAIGCSAKGKHHGGKTCRFMIGGIHRCQLI